VGARKRRCGVTQTEVLITPKKNYENREEVPGSPPLTRENVLCTSVKGLLRRREEPRPRHLALKIKKSPPGTRSYFYERESPTSGKLYYIGESRLHVEEAAKHSPGGGTPIAKGILW